MAKSNLPITGGWWGYNNYEWHDDGRIRAGALVDGTYFRTKIAISTAGLKISKGETLTLSIGIKGVACYPAGCDAILTELDLECYQVQDGSNGPSATLAAATIATATARHANGNAVKYNELATSGTEICYKLAADNLRADKTYYIYLIRQVQNDLELAVVDELLENATVSFSYTSTHPLTIEAGHGASVTVRRGDELLANGDEVTHGDVLTVVFEAAEGYDLTSHTVNGENFASGGSHTVDGPVVVWAATYLRAYQIGDKLYHARIGGKQYTAYIGGAGGKPVPFGQTK